MAQENKTQQTNNSVADFVVALDDERIVGDCHALIGMMTEVTGHEPKMWGSSIIGFDTHHYVYASGREGDAPVLGFSPRTGKFAMYLDANSEARSPELYAKLGKYARGKSCLYIKRLSDVDALVLRQILDESYQHILASSRQN